LRLRWFYPQICRTPSKISRFSNSSLIFSIEGFNIAVFPGIPGLNEGVHIKKNNICFGPGLGTEEAAEYLGIKKSTLYDWVLQRKIPHTKIGRLLKFRIEDLDRWIDKRTKEEKNIIID